jgi:hypothetical protein
MAESIGFSSNLRVQSRLLATDQESIREKCAMFFHREQPAGTILALFHTEFVLSRHRRTTACDPKEDGASGGSTLPNHADVRLLILGCLPA